MSSGRGGDIPLTAHLEDHDRDEWLALTRFLQPINPDPIRSYKMALSTLSSESVKMLRLPPHHRVARWIEYFYEGYVDVVRGEAMVPVEKTEWITRMLNIGYAIPKDEPYLETAPEEVVAKNRLVWTETYPHFSAESQDFYKDVAIVDEEAIDGPATEEPGSEVDGADESVDEGPLDVDAIFAESEPVEEVEG